MRAEHCWYSLCAAHSPWRDGCTPVSHSFQPDDQIVQSKNTPAGLANPYLLLALAALFWSGNHIIGRAVTGYLPPYSIAMVRWLLPLIVLWPFARPHLQRDWPKIVQHWKLVLFIGITGGAIFSAGQYVGLQLTTALNVSVLNSITPAAIVAVGALFFRDRLSPMQIIGILVSSVGVLFIITHGNFQRLQDIDFNRGDIIILVNMILFAVYSCVLRKLPSLHWLSFIFLIAAISAVALTPFSLWEIASGQTFVVSVPTLLAILYFSIFTSFLAYVFWMRGVEKIGAARGGPFLHLIPIYSAVLASVFLGEQLMAYHLIGFLLIIAGVWAASRRSGPKASS
jgi:drug/metabolite transporter (DMT)-like permease